MSNTPNDILFAEDARHKLKCGLEILKESVGITLGPKGGNALLQTSAKTPMITNDGYSISRDIQLKDQFENMGVSLGKELANKIKEKSGDGTTTGIILLNALFQNGIKNITAGANPILLKRGIEQGVRAILKELNKLAIPVTNEEDIKKIATVSANGSQEIGHTLYEAMGYASKNGVITIEDGKGVETIIDVVEGMQINGGYLSPYFCTNTEKMTSQMISPAILITDQTISSIHDLLPLLQMISSSGKELVIIAENIERDALSSLVLNRLRATLKVTAIKAPGFGEQRMELLQDLAILTGATLVTKEKGMLLKDIKIDMLGGCDRLEVTKNSSTIINGSGDILSIENHSKQLQRKSKEALNTKARERLEERAAKLLGGVVVIRVGALSEIDLKQKKQLFEDSLNSTKAAKEEGFAPGGGIALLRCREILKSFKNLQKDVKLGLDILYNACSAPFTQIVKNSGYDPSLALEEVLNSERNVGFNALTGKVEDLIEASVIDPILTIKNCLQFAASIASVALLTEVLIGDAQEEMEG